jgi:hypothetical protein
MYRPREFRLIGSEIEWTVVMARKAPPVGAFIPLFAAMFGYRIGIQDASKANEFWVTNHHDYQNAT